MDRGIAGLQTSSGVLVACSGSAAAEGPAAPGGSSPPASTHPAQHVNRGSARGEAVVQPLHLGAIPVTEGAEVQRMAVL